MKTKNNVLIFIAVLAMTVVVGCGENCDARC